MSDKPSPDFVDTAETMVELTRSLVFLNNWLWLWLIVLGLMAVTGTAPTDTLQVVAQRMGFSIF